MVCGIYRNTQINMEGYHRNSKSEHSKVGAL